MAVSERAWSTNQLSSCANIWRSASQPVAVSCPNHGSEGSGQRQYAKLSRKVGNASAVGNEHRGARSIALCDLFCVTAGLRFRSNRIALETEAVDDQRRVVAAQVRERGGYSIPDAVVGPDTAI